MLAALKRLSEKTTGVVVEPMLTCLTIADKDKKISKHKGPSVPG